MTLSGAIREAVEDLGIEVNKREVASWLKERYPELQYKPSTLSSTLSGIRKKLRGAYEAEADASRAPTIPDLLLAKKLANERGGVDDFLSLVVQIQEAAEEVGGLPQLRDCLEALQKLTD